MFECGCIASISQYIQTSLNCFCSQRCLSKANSLELESGVPGANFSLLTSQCSPSKAKFAKPISHTVCQSRLSKGEFSRGTRHSLLTEVDLARLACHSWFGLVEFSHFVSAWGGLAEQLQWLCSKHVEVV